MTAAFNLSQLANKVNTSGQLAASSGLSGSVPVANGGTGATTLTANAVLTGNGTSAVGSVAPGTSGNVLTSNGTTWVSQAPSGGGVTSLNGQTGAITNTNVDSIGSYLVCQRADNSGLYGTKSSYSQGSTIAGSTLRYNYALTSNLQNGFTTAWFKSGFNASYNGGGSSLSGTWRCMSSDTIYVDAEGQSSFWMPGLWVRIS